MNAAQFSGDIPLLRKVLGEARTIAVVGLSQNWNRPSFFASKYMQDHGYRIIPVNPAYDEILGERCYDRVADIDEPIDMVDCFRRPQDLAPILEDAISIGARCLWLQIGVINVEVAQAARDAGLDVIMDRCVKIEHARLFGGLNFVGVNTRVISSKRSKIVHN